MKPTPIEEQLTTTLRQLGQPQLKFWNWVTRFGLQIYGVISMGLVLVSGLIWWHVLIALALMHTIVIMLQAIIRRPRPDFERLTGYRMWVRSYSCPSAHSAAATCATLTILAFTNWGSTNQMIMVAIIMFLLATAVGYSRIVVAVHYLGDVLFGLLLGIVFGIGYASVFLV